MLSHKKEQNIAICTTGMDLEIIILSEVDWETQIPYIIYLWNLKKKKNQLIYKTETESQIQKTNLWLSKGKVGEIN